MLTPGQAPHADFPHQQAILIDCPPQVSPELVSLLAGADRLVIPTRPAWPALFNGGLPPVSVERLAESLTGQVERVTFHSPESPI